jgi:hypothetical protein
MFFASREQRLSEQLNAPPAERQADEKGLHMRIAHPAGRQIARLDDHCNGFKAMMQ